MGGEFPPQLKTEGNVSMCCIYFVVSGVTGVTGSCTVPFSFSSFFCQVLGSLLPWALRSLLVILSPFVRDPFQGCMQNLIFFFFGEEFGFFYSVGEKTQIKDIKLVLKSVGSPSPNPFGSFVKSPVSLCPL